MGAGADAASGWSSRTRRTTRSASWRRPRTRTGSKREKLLRRKWELTIDAGDRRVKRDGQQDAKTGRQAIAALWDAWETGAGVNFKDIDNDSDPVTYLVSIVGMEEKAAKPADGARWGESTVTLTLEEGAPGAVALPVSFLLDNLGDVQLTGLLDGQVIVYDTVTGKWVNEFVAGGGPHSHDAGDIVTGLLANPRIATGTPDGTKFLRDDQVWANPPGGGGGGGSGDVVGPAASVDKEIALFDATTGKLLERATETGILQATAGVLGVGLASSGAGDVIRKDGPVFGAGSATAGSKPKLTSGALLTVPEPGAIEFLDRVHYLTPSAGGRAVNWASHLSRLAADSSHWGNVATPVNVFPAGQDSFNAPGSTTYFFELICRLLVTGTTATILGFGLAGRRPTTRWRCRRG